MSALERELAAASADSTVDLFPPYVLLYNKIEALFGDDPDLNFSFLDDETKSFTIASANRHKLAALEKALNTARFKEMGLTVNFEYTGADSPDADFLNDLFQNNPHFSRAYVTTDAATGFPHTLCYFKDETIQYSADDRFVPYGYETRLAEQLVAELFNSEVRRMKYVTEAKQ